jgi:hypothetical protein
LGVRGGRTVECRVMLAPLASNHCLAFLLHDQRGTIPSTCLQSTPGEPPPPSRLRTAEIGSSITPMTGGTKRCLGSETTDSPARHPRNPAWEQTHGVLRVESSPLPTGLENEGEPLFLGRAGRLASILASQVMVITGSCPRSGRVSPAGAGGGAAEADRKIRPPLPYCQGVSRGWPSV